MKQIVDGSLLGLVGFILIGVYITIAYTPKTEYRNCKPLQYHGNHGSVKYPPDYNDKECQR